jgi:sugar/nucleoside kinase (ribokinase family)
MAEVYCFGHVSTGRILRIRDKFPAPDGYGEIIETLENHAGEATGTALVLNRLGISVALEGNWIGDVPECRRTLDFLRERGIDCSGLRVVPGYPGVTEYVFSDRETRTVFGRYCDLLFTKPQWDQPDPAKIAAARIVSVDSSFGDTALRAARIAGERSLPMVTYDSRHDAELTARAAALIISREFLRREYPEVIADDLARGGLFRRYLAATSALVVFTSGSRPLWWARGIGPQAPGDVERIPIQEFAPFPVEVIDSAGAGDSFRGGIIYGMLQGWSDAEGVKFASATAALICTRAPGCVHPPSLAEIQSLAARRA